MLWRRAATAGSDDDDRGQQQPGSQQAGARLCLDCGGRMHAKLEEELGQIACARCKTTPSIDRLLCLDRRMVMW